MILAYFGRITQLDNNTYHSEFDGVTVLHNRHNVGSRQRRNLPFFEFFVFFLQIEGVTLVVSVVLRRVSVAKRKETNLTEQYDKDLNTQKTPVISGIVHTYSSCSHQMTVISDKFHISEA